MSPLSTLAIPARTMTIPRRPLRSQPVGERNTGRPGINEIRIMNLAFAEREAEAAPDRKAICPRVPGHDVDEANVRDYDERDGRYAVSGEKKEIILKHHAVDQHRPGLAQVERTDTKFAKAINLSLPKIASLQMRQTNRPLMGGRVQQIGKERALTQIRGSLAMPLARAPTHCHGERSPIHMDRGSLRSPEHGQSLQPIFCVINSDDRALADLPGAQPSRIDFVIGFGAAKAIPLTKFKDAQRTRTLLRAPLSLAFRQFFGRGHFNSRHCSRRHGAGQTRISAGYGERPYQGQKVSRTLFLLGHLPLSGRAFSAGERRVGEKIEATLESLCP